MRIDGVDPVGLLARLVAAPSPNPPGDERAVAEVVTTIAAKLGLPPAVTHASLPARPNLIFQLGQGSPSLLLAAHTDTMPPGDADDWESDPYDLCERDGSLFGVGSADMKGPITCLLLAAARLVREPERTGSLTLVLSADEEAGSAYGMAWLANEGLLGADDAVMVEPSSLSQQSWERLYVGQRGSCVASLVAHGTPGHSGAELPAQERASAAFARALSTLIEAELFPSWSHPVDGAAPTVNVATMVEGGTVPYAHPESLRATIEVRTIEGMTEAVVLEELRGTIASAGLSDRVSIMPAESPFNWFPPGDTVQEGRLLTAATKSWRETLGTSPELGIFGAATDSAHVTGLGIPALPAFGPGSLGGAHRPNESIPARDLPQAVDLFESLIRNYVRGDS